MNIINANNLKFKPALLNLLKKMPNKVKDYPVEDYANWLDKNLGNENFGVWFAFHQIPVGLITCEIIDTKNDKYVFVSFWYVLESIKNEDVAGDLFRHVEEWAKSKDIHRIVGETIRLSGVRAFMKKYNIKVEKIILSKEI
ncbi:MAG: GNAT family N-acetyltransferase [Candidatus Micrarchaeia archaeon]